MRPLIILTLFGIIAACDRKADDSVGRSTSTGMAAAARSVALPAVNTDTLPDSASLDLSKLDSLINVAAALDAQYGRDASNAAFKVGMEIFFEPPPSPVVQPFADGANWMLHSAMVYQIGDDYSLTMMVPKGFVTDFASIPKKFHSIMGSTGPYANASVIHDYLYWLQACSRKQADNIMAIAMQESRVGPYTAKLIHTAVRKAGAGAWSNNQSERQAGLVRTVAAPDDQVPPIVTWRQYRDSLRTAGAKPGDEPAVTERFCQAGNSTSFGVLEMQLQER